MVHRGFRNFSLRRSLSDRRNQSELEWQDILQYLECGQYDRAKAFFEHMQEAVNQAERADLKIISTAAAQICLACAQMKSEEERYRRSLQDLLHNEGELQQELLEITQQLMEWDLGQGENALSEAQTDSIKKRITPQSPLREKVLQQILHKFLGAKPPRVREEVVEMEIPPLPILKERPTAFSPIDTTVRELPPFYSLHVFCLGLFQVYLNGQIVVGWSSSKGKSIFKYLVTHKERPVAKEVLMDLFWRDASPESARRNLNWAIHSLRQALHKNQPGYSHVLFQNEYYLLNPDLRIWVDVCEFKEHLRKAYKLEENHEPALAMREFQAAEMLYQGDFLEEDRYEDWILSQRQSLQNDCLSLLERLSLYHYDQEEYDKCISTSRKMLALDPCWEEAHLRLMQCYLKQGYPYLAIRQYHLCVEKLKVELDVTPSPKTAALFNQIRLGQGMLEPVCQGNLQD